MVKPNDIQSRVTISKEAEILHSDKGYELSTHEKQAEFAKKRNYHYTNTDNPIDFPKHEWDDWKPIEDIL